MANNGFMQPITEDDVTGITCGRLSTDKTALTVFVGLNSSICLLVEQPGVQLVYKMGDREATLLMESFGRALERAAYVREHPGHFMPDDDVVEDTSS